MLANLLSLSAELPSHESTITFKPDGRCALSIVRGSIVALFEGPQPNTVMCSEQRGERIERTSQADASGQVGVDAHRQNTWMSFRATHHVIDPAYAKAVWARRNLDVEQGPLA